MDKATKFRTKAQQTVSKFSNGNCTYKSFKSESYDAVTGKPTRQYDDVEQVPYALDKIQNEKLKSYSNKSSILYLAGLDLGAVVPKRGDAFISKEGYEFFVEEVETDMYNAHYDIIVTEVTDEQ